MAWGSFVTWVENWLWVQRVHPFSEQVEHVGMTHWSHFISVVLWHCMHWSGDASWFINCWCVVVKGVIIISVCVWMSMIKYESMNSQGSGAVSLLETSMMYLHHSELMLAVSFMSFRVRVTITRFPVLVGCCSVDSMVRISSCGCM